MSEFTTEISTRYAKLMAESQAKGTSGQIGNGNALAQKQRTLQDYVLELVNHLYRLGADQSIIRERLFNEGESNTAAPSSVSEELPRGLEQLLALACQTAGNLVGQSEGILRRL